MSKYEGIQTIRGGLCRRLVNGAVGAAALAWLGMPVAFAATETDAARAELDAEYAKYLRETKGILGVRTLQHSKLGTGGVDLVVVSAGFQAAEQETFFALCETLKESFFTYPPWGRYRDWVGFHAVFVDDESVDKSRVRVSGYKGQILTCDNGTASEYAMVAAKADGVVVLHNSDFSTASCGVWGVSTINKVTAGNAGAQVHELGHAMAGLGDEYIQRSGPFDGTPESLWNTVNVTAIANPRLCRWHYWTVEEWPGPLGTMTYRGSSPVGNFEGAGWPTGIYRPEENCMMRGSRPSFCVVCDETMQGNLFRYSELLPTVEPAREDLVLWKGESIDFRVEAMAPLRDPPAWLASRLDLYLDGKRVARSERGEVAYRLDSARTAPGIHHLGAQLNIQSEAIRRDFGFLSDSRAWRVRVMPHAKPVLTVPPKMSVPSKGTIDVPVAIKHRHASLFALRMEHAPANAVLENGRFKWKPDGASGSWRVDFVASFEGQDAVTASMEIQVDRADGRGALVEMSPMASIEAVVGKPVSARLAAADPDGGHLLFEAVELPEGAALDRTTGEVTWTPSADQAGPQRLRFRVRNGLVVSEGAVAVRVRRPGKPTPVSYSNTYIPDTLERLKQTRESPLLYRRIWEPLRLLRDRYARIYEPALADAEAMAASLDPKFRDQVLQELSMHAWAFTDKPAVLGWMRRLAEGDKTDSARALLRKLDLMADVDKIKKIEIEGGRPQVISLAILLAQASDPILRAAMERAVRAIGKRMNDDEALRQELMSALAKTRGPGRAALVSLLPLARTPELTAALTLLSRDSDKAVAGAARQALDYFEGFGKTGDFIISWKLSKPYLAEGRPLFEHAFDPELNAESGEWKACTLEANAQGAYLADLGRLVGGGDQRAAYMKTTLRSAKEQEVLFGAGSDDGIKVWLNGALIHAKNTQRGVKPGEDQFRGRLKAGDNVLLVKIVQYHLGWGACMSLRASDGGPVRGVTVPADAP